MNLRLRPYALNSEPPKGRTYSTILKGCTLFIMPTSHPYIRSPYAPNLISKLGLVQEQWANERVGAFEFRHYDPLVASTAFEITPSCEQSTLPMIRQ